MPKNKKNNRKAAKSAAKKPARKPAKPAIKKPTAQPAKKAPRQPSAAFMKPMSPSMALAAVVGPDPLPRTEITRRIWNYIREKQLQDSQNRRVIKADDLLRPIFGGLESVNMFALSKLVNQNLSVPPAPPASASA